MKRVRDWSFRAARVRAGAGDRGAAVVEFAFIAILLFMILFGIIVFARYMWLQQAVNAASREAARFGSAIGSAQYEDCTGIREAARDLTPDISLSEPDIVIQYIREGGSSPFAACGDPLGGLADGDRIRVTVSTPMDVTLPLVGGVFDGDRLSATAERSIFPGTD